MKKLNFSLLGLIPLFLVAIIGNIIINYSLEREINDDWEFLLNSNNLTEWKIKIKGHKFGENFKNTFKVENNSIKVSYENYDSFEDKFGHIFFTKKKFENYHLSLEYKFNGDHLNGAPSWSIKNSGIMLHCQDPKTMLINQDFPVSAEVQLLGHTFS